MEKIGPFVGNDETIGPVVRIGPFVGISLFGGTGPVVSLTYIIIYSFKLICFAPFSENQCGKLFFLSLQNILISCLNSVYYASSNTKYNIK